MAKKKEVEVTEEVSEEVQVGAEASDPFAANESEEIDPVHEAIKAAFVESVDNGSEEDDTKMAMIAAGAKFKNVNRLFNGFMVELGYSLSKDDKEDILAQVLDGLDLSEVDTFDSAVSELSQRLQTSEKSAAGSLRQWAKKREIPFYIKPKSETSERSGITATIHSWILENATAKVEDLYAYIKEVGTENTERNKTQFAAILKLANKIVTKYS